MAQRRIWSMRAWIWSAVAWGRGGPPQAWRRLLWMTPCGWFVRWLHAPTRPLSSLRSAASAWRLTGGATGAAGAEAPAGAEAKAEPEAPEATGASEVLGAAAAGDPGAKAAALRSAALRRPACGLAARGLAA